LLQRKVFALAVDFGFCISASGKLIFIIFVKTTVMLGAIIGDVVGSTYEFHNTKDYNFKLFPRGSKFTDDTIMSLAVASTLMKYRNNYIEDYQLFEDEMVRLGTMFPVPKGGYGGGFAMWLFHPEFLSSYDGKEYPKSKTGRHPYCSNGNGAAMRVSSIGWFYDSFKMTCRAAYASADITHNSQEGRMGACAVANAIRLAREGKSKEEIREFIESNFGYDLSKTWKYWHEIYKWDSSCSGTVPQAIICFLESTTFEDAIRNAVSLGGDSDTLACITGGIAEAYYKKIPSFMYRKAMDTLPKVLKDILKQFQDKVNYWDIVKLV